MSLFTVTSFSLNQGPNEPVRNLCLMSEADGSLRYDEERVVYRSTAKFGYEEPENKVQGEVRVHFRCLHNNKYLVRQTGTDWLVATATEPVEDVSSPNSTLFRVEMVPTGMRWVHLAAGTTAVVGISPASHPTASFYLRVSPGGNDPVACTPIDVERIIKLPETVVFKADDGKYLQVEGTNQDQLKFTGDDRHKKEAWFNIIPLSNGDVRVMCHKSKMFLKRQTTPAGLIKPQANTNPTDSETHFRVARLSNNTIALINQGADADTCFCTRSGDLFKAEVDSGVKQAGLVVEEPVVTRNIEVEFRLEDARIYDVQPRSWLSQVAHNKSDKGDLTTTLSIAYSEALSCKFSKTTTVVTEAEWTTTFTASIPFVADVESVIRFSAGKTVETSFEETLDKSETMEFSATVIVPPGGRRRARIMANEAKCDVPFTYVQTEVLADNTIVRTVLEDGIYRGMNGYEFHVQVYDPERPDEPEIDEPVACRMLPDILGREKIYRRMMKK